MTPKLATPLPIHDKKFSTYYVEICREYIARTGRELLPRDRVLFDQCLQEAKK